MRRILAVLALVAACALLAGLLAGCVDSDAFMVEQDRQIERCEDLGGVAETAYSVSGYRMFQGCDFPCPPAGGWPGLERELREATP
jgi:hypothetical protein